MCERERDIYILIEGGRWFERSREIVSRVRERPFRKSLGEADYREGKRSCQERERGGRSGRKAAEGEGNKKGKERNLNSGRKGPKDCRFRASLYLLKGDEMGILFSSNAHHV